MKTITVLGTNLEGMLAGHACALLGYDVVWLQFGIDDEAPPNVLDFLTAPIPLTQADVVQRSLVQKGDPGFFFGDLLGREYAKQFPLPWDNIDGRLLFNPAAVHTQLQETYRAAIQTAPDPAGDEFARYMRGLDGTNITINALNASYFCVAEHMFGGVQVAAKPFPKADDGRPLTYSGDNDDPWLIEGSTFFGGWRLYPGHRTPPVNADLLRHDFVPQKTNCDCFPTFGKVGRLARWESGYQLHRAFYDTFAEFDRTARHEPEAV